MGTIEAYGTNIINSKGESYTEITWDEWNALSRSQQQAIPRAMIKDVPGVNGTVSAELLKTLWVNTSPTAAFAAQNITLSSDDYDLLIWVFRFASTVSNDVSAISVKGDGLTVDTTQTSGSGVYNVCRSITRSSDASFAVSAGTIQFAGQTQSTDNARLVPLVVYGLKKSISFDISALISNVSTDASKCMLSDSETSVENALTATNISSSVSFGSTVTNGDKTVWKQGKLVIVVGRALLPIANNAVIFTGLPAPASLVKLGITTGNGTSLCDLDTSGTLTITSAGATSSVWSTLNFTYICS